MRRIIVLIGMILFFRAGLCFADEEITITTYYPSPNGVYDSMYADKFGVGDNDGGGTINPADVPTTSGDIWIAGKVGIGTGTTSPNNLLQVKELINFDNANHSTFLGYQAGNSNNAASNSAVGYRALYSNTTGWENSALGVEALYFNTAGGLYNSAVGYRALYSNATGDYGSAVGYRALFSNTTGFGNSALGGHALFSNITGWGNSALGTIALRQNTTGEYNSAVGTSALYYTQTGSNNTAVGSYAGNGVANNSFSNNSLFGYRAGYVLRTGSNNILIGYQAGDNLSTGSNNIIIGYDLNAPSATGNNQMYLGGVIYADLGTGNVGIGTTNPTSNLHISETGGPNFVFLDNTTDAQTGLEIRTNQGETWFCKIPSGRNFLSLCHITAGEILNVFKEKRVGINDFDPDGVFEVNPNETEDDGDEFVVKSDGKVGIGTTSPAHLIHLNGGAYCDGTGDWIPGSSREFKKDIKPLTPREYRRIADKLKDIQIVRYRYKNPREDQRLRIGVISEDAPEEFVTSDKKGVSPMDAIGFLLAAVKAQQEEIRVLKEEISKLKNRL